MKTLSLPDGIAVIAAEGAHGPAIAELHKSCFDEAWSIFTVRQVLAMSGAFGMVAAEEGVVGAGGISGGDLLGFALGRSAAGECDLLSLAVTAGQRGRGIGTARAQNNHDRYSGQGPPTASVHGLASDTEAQTARNYSTLK